MTCSVIGCMKPVAQNGWCGMHRSRWQRHGDPSWVPPTVEDRVFSKVKQSGDCWLWTGGKVNGYGQISINDRHVLVHRWSYEFFVDEIPTGLTIDHLCRRPSCINPAHLDPVPNAVNIGRAAQARTHCPSGHELTPSNTYTSEGYRRCKACKQSQNAARREHQKAKRGV